MNNHVSWLPYATALAALVASIIAALINILLAIWNKRTQQFIVTRQSEFQKDLNQSIAELNDSLERDRSFSAFNRERIVSHLSEALTAYNKISALDSLAGRRTWTESGRLPESEAEFYSQMYSLKTHLGILKQLGSLPTDQHESFLRAWWAVDSKWANLIDELTLRDPQFRSQHPNAKEFSPHEIIERWCELRAAFRELDGVMLALYASVSVPK